MRWSRWFLGVDPIRGPYFYRNALDYKSQQTMGLTDALDNYLNADHEAASRLRAALARLATMVTGLSVVPEWQQIAREELASLDAVGE